LCPGIQCDRLPRLHGIEGDKVAVPLPWTKSLSVHTADDLAIDARRGIAVHSPTGAGYAFVNPSMEDGKQMSQKLLFVRNVAPIGAADRGRSVPPSR
jgi:hypothetical protein